MNTPQPNKDLEHIRKEIRKTLSELHENLITEKLTNVDDDVNLIYNKYFEDDVNEIERTGKITPQMFRKDITHTETLNTEESTKGHKLNPCTITINGGSNYYQPSTNIISISVSFNALKYIESEFNGNIQDAIKYSPQAQSISKEFTEERIKGSIHHELAHWLDDTLNNKHLNQTIKNMNKARESGKTPLKGTPVNSTKFEIQAQIHNVKQLYNKYNTTWNSLTFQDMLAYSPPLNSIYNSLTEKFKSQWIRDLKKRMHREGLLGDNMVN